MPRFKITYLHVNQHGDEERSAREVSADNPDQARSIFGKEFRRLHPVTHRQIILKTKLVREVRAIA